MPASTAIRDLPSVNEVPSPIRPHPTRRDLLTGAAAAAAGVILRGRPASASASVAPPASPNPAVKAPPAPLPDTEVRHLPARAVGKAPGHRFFGYYDKFPWDKSGRHLLCHETDFVGRQPKPDDAALLLRIDTADGDRRLPVGTTTAWCWQQGAMLQWLPDAPDRKVLYNSRDGKGDAARFAGIIHDTTDAGNVRLDEPIYALNPAGGDGIGLNFSRLDLHRPGYGYCGLPDPFAGHDASDKDGLRRVDLKTGKGMLIISLAELAAHRPKPEFRNTMHSAYHVQHSPTGKRFAFLHRWGPPGGRFTTRLWTAASADGTDRRLLADHGMISHFDWRDDDTILAWARDGKGRNRFFLIPDRDPADSESWTIVGERNLPLDGHCSYSPDRKWILNDTYPDATSHRTLMLIRVSDGRRFEVGRFRSPPELTGPWRCDLHPRWSRDGRSVCFDSGHEASRGVYVMDVSPLTAG